jgi:hypothetical protein
MPMSMHPFFERSLSPGQAVKQLLDLRFRPSAGGESVFARAGDNPLAHQVEELSTTLGYQLLEKVIHGGFPSGRESPYAHLLAQVVADPSDTADPQPALQVINGTADRSITIFLEDLQGVPEATSKETVPVVLFQMLDQTHAGKIAESAAHAKGATARTRAVEFYPFRPVPVPVPDPVARSRIPQLRAAPRFPEFGHGHGHGHGSEPK